MNIQEDLKSVKEKFPIGAKIRFDRNWIEEEGKDWTGIVEDYRVLEKNVEGWQHDSAILIVVEGQNDLQWWEVLETY